MNKNEGTFFFFSLFLFFLMRHMIYEALVKLYMCGTPKGNELQMW